MEMQFSLEGLCCPVCAGKIEAGIRKLEGVHHAVVDFTAQKLILETGGNEETIIARASSIVKKLEPDIVMTRIGPGATKPEASHDHAHTHDHGHSHGEEHHDAREKVFDYARFGLGIALFITGMILHLSPVPELALFLAAYLLIGGEVLLRALRNITRGQIFDENFLMSLATVGAFAIGEYPEGVAVMLFYQIGEAFQDHAVNNSRRSISALMDIRPDYVNLKRGEEIVRADPTEALVGDLMVVKPGEKVPLDGLVREGRSALDTSALTGESMPRDAAPGDTALSGSINKSGLLVIQVSKVFGESTVSKILDLVQNAGSKKAPIENFITKFARYYTPVVVGMAVFLAIVPPLFIPGALFSDWINRALVFLVVSCPCALVISIPLSFFGGIGGASRQGILVKGSNYLDALTKVETVVFDKTGTLTKGVFTVTEIAPEPGFTNADLLYYAAHAESNSSHPIAISIQRAYGQAMDQQKIKDLEEIAGQGIKVTIDSKTVLAGNSRLLEAENISRPTASSQKAGNPHFEGTLVYLAVDGVYAGHLGISDELKQDSVETIRALKAAGVTNTVMLTGDTRAVGEKIGRELGLDRVYTELLPHQKVEQLEILEGEKSPGGKLVFVGDGINDAPVLARSDIGIAMGGLGSDAAIEAADIVLMTDEPSKLVTALGIAKKTRTIVTQNIVFALGVKGIILVLGALGMANMWEAVFGDVGVAFIAILNASRALGKARLKH
ncbi:cadmium-exporting ATPase [Treponema primitia ZAS-2]|uniref:P-type Zn(2+) transporter n=1 Tax=Treponema primitia (strain ATCC BAA-887 / DSM 12427 / ZAS-2) TaxID=545694 RepID=F5YP54_TREPZ|nr:heavy metal translocating P-type ATPase [Treponema primitia]AEF85879.1 cadmium-exporting ATPase [Treponema primitia ZAS-2]